ncbi:hypothetical protein F4802DRAFT_244804 [Xylaria palmicola]|nr:hypothetical protein F4802DRAFT_244804 [Xylaria palmicola]
MRYINGPLRPACRSFYHDTPPASPGGLGGGLGWFGFCELTVCPPGMRYGPVICPPCCGWGVKMRLGDGFVGTFPLRTCIRA